MTKKKLRLFKEIYTLQDLMDLDMDKAVMQFDLTWLHTPSTKTGMNPVLLSLHSREDSKGKAKTFLPDIINF